MMHKLLQHLLLATTIILFCTQIEAQIVINEYSASNLTQFVDNNQKTEDWIELYNTSSSSVDLSGWHLSDKETNPMKWVIPNGVTIAGNGFLVFLCSGRDGLVLGELHTNFKLSQTKGTDFVVLADPSGTIIESRPTGITLRGHSFCKETDGAANWVISETPTFGLSNNSITPYTRYTVAPSMDVVAGFYPSAVTVSIQNNEPNSTLRYTMDGTLPTEFDPVYTAPITVNSTSVVKARAFSDDPAVLPGKIDFNTYFINETFSLDVYSVAADEVIDLANGFGELRPVGSIEYFGQDGTRKSVSYGELNRHGQDSWVLNHRSLDWVSRDEMGYTSAIDQPIFTYSTRNDHQRLMFRASGDDNYPALQGNDTNQDFDHEGSCHIRDEYVHTLALEGGMKLDVRAVERVIVFLNGQYWGVYGLRERPVDHDYTKEYYDQDKFNLQYLLTWGETWAEYGGNQAFSDWGELRDFILNNDMSIDANYELVKSQMQVKSLIDYMMVNLNTVASDWMNYNTGWWRGMDPAGNHKKWGYILWDNDATFDYYINYSGVPDISPYAEPCDINAISDYMDDFFGSWGSGDVGKHEKIFLKLQEENEEFRQLYYSRSADMMNTVFSCENMISTLDAMVAVIEPEMPRQIQRWGGSMAEWQSNIQDMRNFINIRCEQLDNGMVDCFDLTGPFDLTLVVEPAGVGEIEINTISNIQSFPWTGQYFGNMDNLIEAKSKDPLYTFSHWETANGNAIFPNVNTDSAKIILTGNEVLTAVFTDGPVAIENLQNVSSLTAFPTVTNDLVTIKFNIEEQTDLNFELFNTLGERVAILDDISRKYAAGDYVQELHLNDLNLAQGMYFLSINTGGNTKESIKLSFFR